MEPEHDPQVHTVPPDRRGTEEQPRWRLDFPIDTPQDDYIARRDLTKFLVLTSLAFVVGQFWIALRNMWRRAQGRSTMMLVAPLDKVPVGGAVAFRYPRAEDPALLVRTGEDSLVAYASQCTHLQCPVLPQPESGRLHCPCHAGYFDLSTGEVLAGPPRRPLPRILVEVRDGRIYAVGVEGNA
jgi:nitrite reductase/ring-hydroxylating ferredoxin subunit